MAKGTRTDLPQLNWRSMKIKLPCHERYFSEAAIGPALSFTKNGRNDEQPGTDYPRDESAFMIRLCNIRLAILSSSNDACATPPWQEGSAFARLKGELEQLMREVDTELAYSSTSMFQKRRHGRIVAFTVLHVLIQQVACDLHQTDDSSAWTSTSTAVAADFVFNCRLERFTRAITMCGILADASLHAGIAFDPFIGTCAYQACNILVNERLDARAKSGADGDQQQQIESAIEAALTSMRRISRVSELVRQSVIPFPFHALPSALSTPLTAHGCNSSTTSTRIFAPAAQRRHSDVSRSTSRLRGAGG